MTLPTAAWLMAEFVACLEDDRDSAVIEANRETCGGRSTGTVTLPNRTTAGGAGRCRADPARVIPAGAGQPADGASTDPAVYRMHPGVAAAIHATTPSEVRIAADTELGVYWASVADQVWQREGGEHTALIVHAGLASGGARG